MEETARVSALLGEAKDGVGRIVTKPYNPYCVYIARDSMVRDPRKDDDEEAGRVSVENESHTGGLTSSAVIMRRLQGVPGEWWTLEGETTEEYVAASADSWVELGR